MAKEHATQHHQIRLTSAEIANLWGAYMGNSMSVCVLGYFNRLVEDVDIKEVLEIALSMSMKNVATITGILSDERFPIPVGFSDQDVNLNAPRLYSDTFFLNYLHQTTKSGFSLYTIALPNIARSDVRNFLSECIRSLIELFLIERGIHTSAVYFGSPRSGVRRIEGVFGGIFRRCPPSECFGNHASLLEYAIQCLRSRPRHGLQPSRRFR